MKGLRLVWLWLIVVVLAGCASIQPIQDLEKKPSYRLSQPENSWLGKLFSKENRKHPGESGVLLLDKGEEALLWRGALADSAQKTLDAQYFIWFDDNVGTIAAERLLRAAERGVRVRVIVDDFPLDAHYRHLAFLNAHPNIEIRVYNPFDYYHAEKASVLRKVNRMLHSFSRLNRRMHNKTFIADGTVTILGGRNIADEYFDMNEEWNFRDRDVLVVGDVVKQTSTSFDSYWNSPWVVSLDKLISHPPEAEEARKFNASLHQYALDESNFPVRFYGELKEINSQLKSLLPRLKWGSASLVYDVPGKNTDVESMAAFGRSGSELTKLARQTQTELIAETPYLVMMPGTFAVIKELQEKGVQVRMMTNSLASTDNMPVHAAYARQRRKLINLGVELHELRVDAESRNSLIKRMALVKQKPDLALHAKTAVFDRKTVFIGSFNLDPRSTHLNTEQGLIIHNAEFAEQVAKMIETDLRPENSYRVYLDENGDLAWKYIKDGKVVEEGFDPLATMKKSLQILLFSLLPLKSIL